MRRRDFVAGFAAAAGLAAPARAAGEPIPVGVITVQSGPEAASGISIRAGLELQLAAVNHTGVLGGRPIRLVVRDSGADEDRALAAARELIDGEHAIAIIGPTLSQEMFAVGPFTNEHRIPTIGASTTAEGITDIGRFIFRTALPESAVLSVAMKRAMDKFGIKTIALIHADDLSSRYGFDAMRAAADALGLRIVGVQSFDNPGGDVAAPLARMKGTAPDAIGISAPVAATAVVLRQARQIWSGGAPVLIGGERGNAPELARIAGAAADGLIVGTPWIIGNPDPASQAFVAAFRRRYGSDPDRFAACAYDTMAILAEAIDRAGNTDPDGICAALLKTEYNGVTGHFTFTPHRDPASASGVVVLTIQNGKFQPLA